MKHFLLLPLLLGTTAALHLGNDALYLDSGETQADLSRDLESSGEEEGKLTLTEEVIWSGDQVNDSSYQNGFEDEKAMEVDPSTLDKNLQCPRTEDTVHMPGGSGCRTCRYLLVRTPRTFNGALNVCRRCYRGNLVSIHNFNINNHIRCLTSGLNQQRVWIGATVGGLPLFRNYHWSDGSCWNFQYWAPGEPKCGGGHCVTLGTNGGRWRRTPCGRHLPFICSF